MCAGPWRHGALLCHSRSLDRKSSLLRQAIGQVAEASVDGVVHGGQGLPEHAGSHVLVAVIGGQDDGQRRQQSVRRAGSVGGDAGGGTATGGTATGNIATGNADNTLP